MGFPTRRSSDLLIILVLALIIFGPRKLPDLGRSLGKSIGEFRRASNELKTTLEEEIRLEEVKEQRAKMEAEQASAVEAGNPAAADQESHPPADVSPDEPTVSRGTNTGTTA